MDAFDAIKVINRHRSGAVVLTTMTPRQYWEQVSQELGLDLPIVGAMGKASSVGLGLAMARPDVRVMVLDGDGGLLMNLGSLVTIAEQAPQNLIHFVFQDGVYNTTGGQSIPGAGKVNLAQIAKSAGFVSSYEFKDLEDFANQLADIMAERGPTFVVLKVTHGYQLPDQPLPSTGASMRTVMEVLGNA